MGTGSFSYLEKSFMSYIKVAKAPESAMKTILFVLMKDLFFFLHLTQLEDKHLHMILQTGVSTVTLPFIQMLLFTDLSSPCDSNPWLDNKSDQFGQ